MRSIKYVQLIWVLLYLVGMLRPALPYVEYAINKSYIVQYLCENRDEPRLKCDGKCYLAKQLKATQPTQDQEPISESPSVDLREYPIAIIQEIAVVSASLTAESIAGVDHQDQLLDGAEQYVFRPPIFLS